MEKSILYAKITVSQNKIASKRSFKYYIHVYAFYFHSYNNVTNTHYLM